MPDAGGLPGSRQPFLDEGGIEERAVLEVDRDEAAPLGIKIATAPMRSAFPLTVLVK